MERHTGLPTATEREIIPPQPYLEQLRPRIKHATDVAFDLNNTLLLRDRKETMAKLGGVVMAKMLHLPGNIGFATNLITQRGTRLIQDVEDILNGGDERDDVLRIWWGDKEEYFRELDKLPSTVLLMIRIVAGEQYKQVNPGAIEFMADLKQRDLDLHIISNSREKSIDKGLMELEKRWFPPNSFASRRSLPQSGFRRKPSPDGLIDFKSKLDQRRRDAGIEPSEVIYIGDNNYDLLAAYEAGMIPIIISSHRGNVFPPKYPISHLRFQNFHQAQQLLNTCL